MKKLSLLLVFTLILTMFAPTFAFAAEAKDNSTAVNATSFTTSIKDKLEENKDVNYYKVQADDDYYTFTFKVSTSNLGADTQDGWDVTFYDSKMNELYSDTVKNTMTTPRFCIPGTVYVKVAAHNTFSMYAPDGISYDLTYSGGTDAYWENEYNNLSTSANAIKVNTTYRGSLHSGSDADWFVVTPLDYFNVTLKKNMNIATGWNVGDGWKVTVYDKNSAQLTSFNVTSSTTSFSFPVSGPIYIKVEAVNTFGMYAPDHVYYDLKVTSATKSAWEKEYNNSSTTANTMKQGTVYHGNLQKGSDIDFFKVKSTSKAIAVNFTVDLNEVDPDYVKEGWKITVYAADSAKSIASYTVDTLGTSKSITLPYKKGEYYYVKVEAVNTFGSYAPVGQPYHVSVVDASNGKNWEVENGGTTVSSAATLNEGKVIYGNIGYAKDKDYFKCNVISGGTIKVTFNRENSDNDKDGYKVKVIDNAGKVIKETTVNDTTSKSMSGVKVSKGTYYIVVESVDTYRAPGAEINYSLTYALTLAKPSAKLTPTKSTMKVSWDKRSDVTGYQIEYATNKNFEKAKKVTVSKNTTDSYTIKDTAVSKAYYVRLRTYVKTEEKTYYSPWSATVCKANTPTIAKVTPNTNTLSVSWNKNTGAVGYQIQYATNKNFENAKTVKINKNGTTSTVIKDTSATKVYYVRMRVVTKAGDETFYSPWSAAVTAINTPTVAKVTPNKNTLKVSWNKNSGASGYQIQYATDKNFSDAQKVSVSSRDVSSVTIKNTSAEKTYYVRLRTVVKGSETVYSPWSASYTVKTK